MKTFLALGDSYTIGEQVNLHESFPYQTVQLLRRQGMAVAAPEITAKTGWTTDELQAQINATTYLGSYDFVTLLIGVNNQYRARSAADFSPQFEQLLRQAISFAGGKAAQVYVLSIPDWGVTPFADGQNRGKIAQQIDDYNNVCATTAVANNCNFIDITTAQRLNGANEAYLTADRLHPSAAEYAGWAQKLAAAIVAASKQ